MKVRGGEDGVGREGDVEEGEGGAEEDKNKGRLRGGCPRANRDLSRRAREEAVLNASE